MRVIIEPDYKLASQWTANYIAMSINEFSPGKDKPFVLGLPTGSSPLGTYKELIKLNNFSGLTNGFRQRLFYHYCDIILNKKPCQLCMISGWC